MHGAFGVQPSPTSRCYQEQRDVVMGDAPSTPGEPRGDDAGGTSPRDSHIDPRSAVVTPTEGQVEAPTSLPKVNPTKAVPPFTASSGVALSSDGTSPSGPTEISRPLTLTSDTAPDVDRQPSASEPRMPTRTKFKKTDSGNYSFAASAPSSPGDSMAERVANLRIWKKTSPQDLPQVEPIVPEDTLATPGFQSEARNSPEVPPPVEVASEPATPAESIVEATMVFQPGVSTPTPKRTLSPRWKEGIITESNVDRLASALRAVKIHRGEASVDHSARGSATEQRTEGGAKSSSDDDDFADAEDKEIAVPVKWDEVVPIEELEILNELPPGCEIAGPFSAWKPPRNARHLFKAHPRTPADHECRLRLACRLEYLPNGEPRHRIKSGRSKNWSGPFRTYPSVVGDRVSNDSVTAKTHLRFFSAMEEVRFGYSDVLRITNAAHYQRAIDIAEFYQQYPSVARSLEVPFTEETDPSQKEKVYGSPPKLYLCLLLTVGESLANPEKFKVCPAQEP